MMMQPVSRATADDGDNQSFAEVMNNLSGGPWWSRGRRRVTNTSTTAALPTIPQQTPAPTETDDWSDPAAASAVVRPYTWTGGRTSPVFDLAVETLVSTSEYGRDVAVLTSEEHRAVSELCRAPRSVAEVAALLCLPLGVARVLLADMANIGLVVVHSSANDSGDTPDMALMERVLSGLRRL